MRLTVGGAVIEGKATAFTSPSGEGGGQSGPSAGAAGASGGGQGGDVIDAEVVDEGKPQ